MITVTQAGHEPIIIFHADAEVGVEIPDGASLIRQKGKPDKWISRANLLKSFGGSNDVE